MDEATPLWMSISGRSFSAHFLYNSAKKQSNHCTLLCNLFGSDTDEDESDTGGQ